jgi:uncharacterized protein YndB with AHSA1/START domain
MEKVFEIYIKTTPERLWEAITDSELRRRYNFGVGVETDWTPGSHYEGVHPLAPGALLEGENLEVDPPRRLVQSFSALWGEDVKREGTELYGGWPMILSGLKTLLETGETLTTPGSLRYASTG